METYKKQLFGYNKSAVDHQQQKKVAQLQEQQAQIATQQQQLVALQTELDQVKTENEELSKKVEKLSHELANYDNIEQTLSTALVVAQEAAQNLRVMAAKEAQLIVQEAQEQAKKEVQQAQQDVQTIQHQRDQLAKELHVFKTRIRMLLEAQLELNADDVWQQIFEPLQNKQEQSIDRDQVNQEESLSELGTVEA